jgi:hypothetical protein
MGPSSGDAKLPSVQGAAPLPSPPTGAGGEGMDGITLKGSAVSSRSNADSGDETSIEKVENRLLKPPPQFGFDAEMKQLASVISREIYQESPNVRSVLALAALLLSSVSVRQVRRYCWVG